MDEAIDSLTEFLQKKENTIRGYKHRGTIFGMWEDGKLTGTCSQICQLIMAITQCTTSLL
jgi:hypothetical protein